MQLDPAIRSFPGSALGENPCYHGRRQAECIVKSSLVLIVEITGFDQTDTAGSCAINLALEQRGLIVEGVHVGWSEANLAGRPADEGLLLQIESWTDCGQP